MHPDILFIYFSSPLSHSLSSLLESISLVQCTWLILEVCGFSLSLSLSLSLVFLFLTKRITCDLLMAWPCLPQLHCPCCVFMLNFPLQVFCIFFMKCYLQIMCFHTIPIKWRLPSFSSNHSIIQTFRKEKKIEVFIIKFAAVAGSILEFY